MGKALIITEKPSVAHDIVDAIGGFTEEQGGEYYESDEYVCTYAVGHILTLLEPEDIDPAYKRWRLADLPIMPDEFQIKPIPRQKKRINVIKKLAKRSDIESYINACDAAREGELIFREIIKFLGHDKSIRRLWLRSMTKKAIKAGFKSLADGAEYEGLAAAAECRAYSDWLIGINATRALTVRLKSRGQRGSSWSAGRVQTPTLALLVERELEILSHNPVPFWRVHAKFDSSDHTYDGTWFDPKFKKSAAGPDDREDRIFVQQKAEEIVSSIRDKPALASETRKEKVRKPPLLFDLTSLQKEANRRFGWSAKRTLGAAQRCYESHKVLTYPRTSSRVLPEDYRGEVDNLLAAFSDHSRLGKFAKNLQSKGLKNEKNVFNDAGVSDHFAIIPTGQTRKLDGDDARLFDLVSRQFFAAFYPPAIFEEVERITVIEEQHFRSKPPLVLKVPGWQECFDKKPATAEEGGMLPLVKGQDNASGIDVKNKNVELDGQATKPPGRIGEAGLLSLMENAGRHVEDEELSQALQMADGLGTAATRADIIENLKSKEYVDQSLRPTVKGIRLIDILHRIEANTLTSAALTGRLEKTLSEVESGQCSAGDYMEQVRKITEDVVERTKSFDYDKIYPAEESLGSCPNCGRDVFERAWFYGCSEATKRTDTAKRCDFLIWKDNYGRYIDKQTASTLLKNKETREIDGFRSRSGKPYKAVLAIEDGKVIRRSVAGSEDPGASFEINEKPLGQCPIHEKDCLVIESSSEFICQKKKERKDEGERDADGFSFPRMLCKREIMREEAVAFIENGETDYLTKFISKRGRPFSAKLKRKTDWGFTFEFPVRAPRKKTGEDGEDSAKEKGAKAEGKDEKSAKRDKATESSEAAT